MSFVKACRDYADDMEIIFKVISAENNLTEIIKKINNDRSIDGVIVHPHIIDNQNRLKELKQLDSKKDISGISRNTKVIPIISKTLDWLLESYNVDLLERK